MRGILWTQLLSSQLCFPCELFTTGLDSSSSHLFFLKACFLKCEFKHMDMTFFLPLSHPTYPTLQTGHGSSGLKLLGWSGNLTKEAFVKRGEVSRILSGRT